jgi:HSP20 family protein
VIRWTPSTELANLHSAMDRLFDDFFGATPPANRDGERSLPTYPLPLDVREVENGYEIHAQVPGFKPEEVDVTFSEGVLGIQAQHSEQSEEKSGGWLRREVAYGNYQRSIQLPGDVKEEDISASFENGILTVTVPKVPRQQPKRIEITSGSQKKQLGGKTS